MSDYPMVGKVAKCYTKSKGKIKCICILKGSKIILYHYKEQISGGSRESGGSRHPLLAMNGASKS